MSDWELFSSHGLVLIYFSRYPRARLRDAAEAIGLTERAVQNNIRDLAASGHLIIEKVGRRNRYKVVGRKHLTHATTRSVSLRQLLQLFKLDEAAAAPKLNKTVKAKPAVKAGRPAAVIEKVIQEPLEARPEVTKADIPEPANIKPAVAEPPWNTDDEINQPAIKVEPVAAEIESPIEKEPEAPVENQQIEASAVIDTKPAKAHPNKTSNKKTTNKKTKDAEADDLPQQDFLF